MPIRSLLRGLLGSMGWSFIARVAMWRSLLLKSTRASRQLREGCGMDSLGTFWDQKIQVPRGLKPTKSRALIAALKALRHPKASLRG